MATMQEYRLSEFTGIHALEMKEVPTPIPGPLQVLVEVYAVSLQQRDLVVANGQYPVPLSPNITPCSDMSGQIIALGSPPESLPPFFNLHVGDRICANFAIPGFVFGDLGAHVDGVLKEYVVFEADPDRLIRIPEWMSYEEACTLPCAGLTAYSALHGPVPFKKGQSIVIQGTSGVSIFVAQFARALGASRIFLTSSSTSKLRTAVSLVDGFSEASNVTDHNGGTEVTGINYVAEPEWDKKVLEMTGGEGVDVVVDIGGASTIMKSIAAVKFGGWIQMVGVIGHEPADLASLPLMAIAKNVCLRGVVMGGAENFRSMAAWLSESPVRVHPCIDKIFAFEDAKEAYEYLAGRGHVGKVVVKVAAGDD
ncbi:NAD-P-binding protein [Stereum hirsutum FP-91666 SS1]|uniref:NAD-P-binding protein n=1 Tax=Stereum hirsutum (strain FP-91666) TaxID=721885 RepID=UPI000444A8E5|nr:NAD-P-binding protein [Stereum hirsutum FP-91666 SS1]EIM85245.1 NAD-P-binding protein [Stereum hirsutum FP-91666 SS1]